MQVTQLYKFLLVLFLSHTAMAQLPFAYGIKRKAYRVESQTSLLQSASSFDASGKQVAFQEGEAFAMVNTSLGMYYGWTNEVELGASLRYRMVGINSLETSSNSIISNRASGLESIQSLVRYKFKPIKNFYYSAYDILIDSDFYALCTLGIENCRNMDIRMLAMELRDMSQYFRKRLNIK